MGIVGRFGLAALDGAVGRLRGVECRVWAANLYLHAHAALGLQPVAQAACNDFNKKMYQHGQGVSTGFCGLLHVIYERIKMSVSKISLNKLGEYMTATPARRRRIIEDQIAPSNFIAARYADARENITNFIVGVISDDSLEQKAIELRDKNYDSNFIAQDKNLSADAIDSFLEISDQLPADYKFEKTSVNLKATLEISGVNVSIRPDIYIKNDNGEMVGAIKLHFPKSNPLTTTSGEYVATALKEFVQENSSAPISPKLCIVIDVPSSTVITAPKAGKKRMMDIEAACEEISAQWKAKTS